MAETRRVRGAFGARGAGGARGAVTPRAGPGGGAEPAAAAGPLAVESLSGERVGAAFRLLMQIRIILAILSLLLVPYERQTLSGTVVVLCAASLSWLGLVAWRQIVGWLVDRPALIAVDVCASYAVLEQAGVHGPFFLFTVMTSAVAGLLYRWPGRVLVFVLQVLVYYPAAVGAAQPVVSVRTILVMPACYPIVGFVGAAVRRLFDEYDRLEESRRRAEVAVAAADERSRLAREMHDSLAKTLRGIALSATALPLWIARSPERAEEEAHRIVAAAEIASREARQLIADLREDIVQRPLDEALGLVVTGWTRRSGVPAQVAVAPAPELPLRGRYELIAIVKEALENVARHARASSVEVRVTREGDESVRLSVADDGRGFAPPGAGDRPGAVGGAGSAGTAGDVADAGVFADFARAGHYGLVGMRERAQTVGGRLTVTSVPGRGTTVVAVFPVAAPSTCGANANAGAGNLDAA